MTAAGVVRDRLAHMRDAIAAIEDFTDGISRSAFAADRLTRDAVERNLERLSEASRHLPQAAKDRHPGIDWKGIAAIGNVLHRAHDRVADRRIWQIVTDDLKPLKAAVEAMAREAGEK